MQAAVLNYQDDLPARARNAASVPPNARASIISSGTNDPFELVWSGSNEAPSASLAEIFQGLSANTGFATGRIEDLSTATDQIGSVFVTKPTPAITSIDYFQMLDLATIHLEPKHYTPDNRFYPLVTISPRAAMREIRQDESYFPVLLTATDGWIGPYNPSDDVVAALGDDLEAIFAAIRNLDDDWDGYGAQKPRTTVVSWLSSELALAIRGADNIPAPDVVPGADGSLQAEWHRKRAELTYNIDLSGERYLWFKDRTTGAESEFFGEEAREQLGQLLPRVLD